MIAATCAAVGGAAGAAALDGGAAAAQSPRARLQGVLCERALDPPARGVAITALMRPLAGTTRMQLRFQLLTKPKGAGAYSAITSGDLGTWITPTNPTLGTRSGDVWKFQKQVLNLAAPAAYRFRVSFRWLGARGRVLGTVTRQSPPCSQPELRPDLLVQSITVQPVNGRPRVNRYVAVIRNAGATATGPFEILFTPGALPVQTATASDLAPHSKLVERFIGPLCSNAAATTVTVDPEDKVDDFNRSNNSLTAVCSGGSSP